MTSHKEYSIEKAAYLLGVDQDALQKLIERDMVDLVEGDEEARVPHHEIARLYGKVEDMLRSLPQKKEHTDAMIDRPERVEAVPTWDEDTIRVDDPELLAIHERIQGYQNRLQNIGAKIKRLGMRAQRLQAMAHGDQARFMERAAAMYPQLWSDTRFSVEKEGDHLLIKRAVADEHEEYRNRLGTLIREGIEKGLLPNGFLGMLFQPPEDGDDAEGDDPHKGDNGSDNNGSDNEDAA